MLYFVIRYKKESFKLYIGKSNKYHMEQANKAHQHIEKHNILRKKKSRNITLNIISLLLAISGILYGSWYFLHFYRFETTNDAIIDQYIVPVNCKSGGFVSDIRFTEHQSVKKGDTLLIIDPKEYIIKVAEAKAALLQAQANNEALIAGALSSESNVAVSQSRVKEREAYLVGLFEKEKRYRMLYQKGAVSRQDMEQVVSDYQASLANLSALKLEETASKAILSVNQKKQLSGIASIDERVAELELALTNLSYTVIIASRDGIMGRRNIEIGQLLQPGQTISNLVEEKNKWITANYREKQIANIYIGQSVIIKVDGYSKKTFKGVVSSISAATGSKYSLLPVDNSAGNFVKVQQRIPVRIEFTNATPEDMEHLRAGMMVETEALIDHNK